MSHRIQNDVGYKKIYPMSNDEDSTFCHYCGRKADITRRLEWDHVPALNVKIPEYGTEIRKTLIRACGECNRLASDLPHMDYIERHLWLKGAYLRRYKRILVNEGCEGVEVKDVTGFLLAFLKNSKIQYEELLKAIGFGICSIDQIESPILQVRTKKGRKIEYIIMDHLYGGPLDDSDDEPEDLGKIVVEEEDLGAIPYLVDEFIEFLLNEYLIGNVIKTFDDYKKWYKKHPGSVYALELPLVPHKQIGLTWDKIHALVLANVVTENEFCSYEQFVLAVSSELFEAEFLTEETYQQWFKKNPHLACDYLLPNKPTELYQMVWDDVLTDLLNIVEET